MRILTNCPYCKFPLTYEKYYAYDVNFCDSFKCDVQFTQTSHNTKLISHLLLIKDIFVSISYPLNHIKVHSKYDEHMIATLPLFKIDFDNEDRFANLEKIYHKIISYCNVS
jgi:hypothetical protein